MAIDVRGVCTLVLVFAMPTSLKFYRDVLGFDVVGTSYNLCFQWEATPGEQPVP